MQRRRPSGRWPLGQRWRQLSGHWSIKRPAKYHHENVVSAIMWIFKFSSNQHNSSMWRSLDLLFLLPLTHTHSLSLSHTFTHTHSYTHTNTHYLSLTHTHTHTHTHMLSLSLSLNLNYNLCKIKFWSSSSLSLSYTHTHTHTELTWQSCWRKVLSLWARRLWQKPSTHSRPHLVRGTPLSSFPFFRHTAVLSALWVQLSTQTIAKVWICKTEKEGKKERERKRPN